MTHTMKRLIVSFLFLGFFSLPVFAAVQTQEIQYKVADTTLKGYLAYDDSIKDQRPGILVVHEWWGNNEYAHRRARMLAELGYVAFALDMYGDGKVAQHPKEASAFVQEVSQNQETAKARFLAGLGVLKNFRLTDPARIAAIGYCFGGGVVLNMAMDGLDLKGVVSFHGSVAPPVQELQPGQVKAKILVCHGTADQFVTPEQMAAFKQALDKAGADYQVLTYEGAKHGFTNPDADELAGKFDLPIAYNASADQKSWQDMQKFLKKNF